MNYRAGFRVGAGVACACALVAGGAIGALEGFPLPGVPHRAEGAPAAALGALTIGLVLCLPAAVVGGTLGAAFATIRSERSPAGGSRPDVAGARCRRCAQPLTLGLSVCPHCGPAQELSAAEKGRQQRDSWVTVAPTVLGVGAGWLLFRSGWAIAGGALVGMLVGVAVVAALYAREGRR
jgi:hypothetical protein